MKFKAGDKVRIKWLVRAGVEHKAHVEADITDTMEKPRGWLPVEDGKRVYHVELGYLMSPSFNRVTGCPKRQRIHGENLELDLGEALLDS